MLDGTFLLAIKQETEKYAGGRVDKIHQPSREEIVISIRSAQGNIKILASSSGTAGRIHITHADIENPQTPPMFCMLLRKKLSGAKFLGIRQEGLERILYRDFEALNELGDTVRLTLVSEIMGKYSNLILINGDGKIVDSLRRIDDIEGERLILPGVTYTTPARRERLNFLIADRQEVTERILSLTGRPSLAKELIGIFEGISPVLAREWIYSVTGETDISTDDITESVAQSIADRIALSAENFLSGRREYTLLTDNDGLPKDFCFESITQYRGLMNAVRCESAGETLDRFYSERDRLVRMKQRYQDLFRFVQSLYERVMRRTDNQRRELGDTEKREDYKLRGDLISANLYKLEKGMSSFECENFYDENCPVIKIRLDPMLTPSQNMQKMYKAYRKADTAAKRLRVLIDEGEKELSYIDSVRDALSRAENADDISELREELSAQGYIKSPGRKQKSRPTKPRSFTSPDGFEILIGRNNRQNDELTCRIADKRDIWLHTKDITGSHVIIRADGREIPDSTIRYAAGLAAFYSSAASSSQVPVDYTFVKYVKKPSGAKPGMVIFTNNRTLFVKPSGASE
ncbi:MAG: NFACT family protein [Oscillospiraceae bacterium]|nr:NFACT family protein [Oscillospiraceae bacterium]